MQRLALIFFLLPFSVCCAQSNFANVQGVVRDSQHRPIVHAQLSLTSLSTGAIRHFSSNSAGLYDAPANATGTYSLEVQAPGFATVSRQLSLEVGQNLSLDFDLPVASLDQTVAVQGSAVVLDTTRSSVGEVIEPHAIKDLPLNGRMILDLALTVPGAHMGSGAQQGDINPLYWRPGQNSALSLGGARPNSNFFLLDGGSNTDPTFWTQNLSLSPDAVQEFRIDVSSYGADQGGAGGGQVNIVTRAGTQSFHGTVYDYLRNNLFDATSFEQMAGNNHLVQNQFGASLGGPVPHARQTFFFTNFEGFRHVQTDTMISTVPTLAEINGDFSQSRSIKIYDPASSKIVNGKTVRAQFQNNTIPEGQLNSVAVEFMTKYLPRPNFGTPGVDSNNYMDVRNEQQNFNQGTLRLDHNFANGDLLFARYSGSSEAGFTPENLPGFGSFNDNFSQQASSSWNHTFSPRLLNTATFTFSRLSMFRYSQNNPSNDIVSQLEIQGVGFGGPGAFGAPAFAVQGYTQFGDSFAATPLHAWDSTYEGRDELFLERGRHNLKFGGAYQRYLWPMWGFFQNRGFYQFTNGFTTKSASNDGTGSALASFELGLPVVRQRQDGVPSMDLRMWSVQSFAQDEWHITSSTTINYGLRYEYSSPLWDAHYTNSNLDLSSGSPVAFIGGQNGYPNSLDYSNKLNFAPRVGIAHHIEAIGLIARAGYGLFYTPVDFNSWCNQRHNVPYVFPETNQSDNFNPSLHGFNFAPAVLGKTVVSFASFDPHSKAQYIQQWNAAIEKSIGSTSTIEVGYIGARGFHLQRSHLINNALPGPGPLQPRRPIQHIPFAPGTTLPANTQSVSMSFPVSAINLLENTAQSWYDAGYINLRRRYANGVSLLANYTFSKNLSNAPDFRSPMYESAIPQNNLDLAAEKSPSCNVADRVVVSAIYAAPAFNRNRFTHVATEGWLVSTIFQAQSGFPFTVSVFGDTANAGTLLGENPIRANATGKPIFGPGTRTRNHWINSAAFAAPPAYSFGNVGRNSVYGPGMQTLDLSLQRTAHVYEKSSLIVRGDFFNALNHTNLGSPGRFINTPQFGSITMPMTPGREIQLSARMEF